jgi:hypothetical protein
MKRHGFARMAADKNEWKLISAIVMPRMNSDTLRSYFVCAYIAVATPLYLMCIKMRRFRDGTPKTRSVGSRPFRRMSIAGPETALPSRIIPALVVSVAARKIIRLAGR